MKVTGLVTKVFDQKSGVRGNRQWTNQGLFLKHQDQSSTYVTLWNRPDVSDLKGSVVTFDGDDKTVFMKSYQGKDSLQVGEQASVEKFKKDVGHGTKSTFNEGTAPTNRVGQILQYEYDNVLKHAMLLVHHTFKQVAGEKTSLPETFFATVNTYMIAYAQGVFTPDGQSRDVSGKNPDNITPPMEENLPPQPEQPTPPVEGTGDDDIPF